MMIASGTLMHSGELRECWLVLDQEIRAGISGEIDELALEEKRSLLASRVHARSQRQLARYGRAAFAGTAAEYVHRLWHEVTARTGPNYFPAPQLRRRLELLAGWFPPTEVTGCSGNVLSCKGRQALSEVLEPL